MGRTFTRAAAAMLALAVSTAGAHEGAGWDAYLIVRANLEADGTFVACQNPEAIPTDNRCVLKGLVNETLPEKPQRMSGQALLELRLQGAGLAGSPQFVGVGPWINEGSHFASTARDRHLIYYRILR